MGGPTMQFEKSLLAVFALGSFVALPGACGARRRKLEEIDRDLLREGIPKTRCALQGYPRPEIAFQKERIVAKLAAKMRAVGLASLRAQKVRGSVGGVPHNSSRVCSPVAEADRHVLCRAEPGRERKRPRTNEEISAPYCRSTDGRGSEDGGSLTSTSKEFVPNLLEDQVGAHDPYPLLPPAHRTKCGMAGCRSRK
jgi:hypothetical protein